MKTLQQRRLRRGGFTLMEMLVVLGIIVLLVAIVTPRMLGQQKKADIKAAQTQIKMLQKALQLYSLDMKEFPTTEQGLAALVSCPADVSEAAAARWDGPYTEGGEIPKDPWGNDYQYQYPPVNGTSGYPDIWSYGPDGIDGTEDDICSWTGSGSTESSARPEQ